MSSVRLVGSKSDRVDDDTSVNDRCSFAISGSEFDLRSVEGNCGDEQLEE